MKRDGSAKQEAAGLFTFGPGRNSLVQAHQPFSSPYTLRGCPGAVRRDGWVPQPGPALSSPRSSLPSAKQIVKSKNA